MQSKNEGNSIVPKDMVSSLGVTSTKNHNWHFHVSSIAKSAACKLGFLFRSKNYFSAENKFGLALSIAPMYGVLHLRQP